VNVPGVLADVLLLRPCEEMSIEVDEGDFEMRRQVRADQALAGDTETDQRLPSETSALWLSKTGYPS